MNLNRFIVFPLHNILFASLYEMTLAGLYLSLMRANINISVLVLYVEKANIRKHVPLNTMLHMNKVFCHMENMLQMCKVAKKVYLFTFLQSLCWII